MNHNINFNTVCIIPWVHTHVEIDGDVKPCCLYNGTVGNTNKLPLDQIWTSKEYVIVRRQMLNGEAPQGCRECFNKEALGGNSKRKRENMLRASQFDLITTESPDFKIKYVDIRVNNICNYKCRICGPLSSHSINAENKQQGRFHYDVNLLSVNKETTLNPIYKQIENLDEIYFCGGEPLYTNEHYEFLDKLLAAGNTAAHIRYSTNLSKLQFKQFNVIDYWQKFDRVSVYASLDGIGNKLEYSRHGAIWSETKKNIETIIKMPNVLLGVSITVSIFNILDLSKIVQTYKDLGIADDDIILGNVLQQPIYYSIQALPKELKQEAKSSILQYLQHNTLSKQLTSMFRYIISFMFDEHLYDLTKDSFIDETNTLDSIRNESFAVLYPEFKKYYEALY